jgi:hypothetical protein
MFNANVTISEFISMEFDLHDIKNLGFIKSEWITTGYTAITLKNSGFTIDDLLFNGFDIIDLNIGFTVNEWKSSTRWETTLTNLVLKNNGYTLQDQINIGFTYTEANIGYERDEWLNLVDSDGNIINLTPEELKSIGFTIDDLYNIGFGLSEIKPLDFTKNDWINSIIWENNTINLYSLWSIGNFSFTELFNLGFNTLLEYKNSNFTPNDLNTVYTIDQLLDGGYTVLSLVTAYSVSDWKSSTRWGTTLTNLILKDNGYTLQNQLNIGFTIPELNIGYLRNEWFANNVTTYQLKVNGYTINDLLIKSQFTLSDLNIQFTQTIIGFLKTEWVVANISLTQLRLAGYELVNIKPAGYTRRDVRDAGYTIQDIDIYYPPSLVRLNTQQYMSSGSPYVTLNTGGGTSLDDSILGSLGGNLEGGTTRYLYFEVKQAGNLYYYIIPNTTDSSPGTTPARFNDYGQFSHNNTKLGPKIGGNMLGTGINGSFAQGVKNNVSIGDILELVYIKDNFISTEGDKVDILELYIVPV